MKLKTFLFVCFISFLSSSLIVQKCKYNFDKLDKMTNERAGRITFTIKKRPQELPAFLPLKKQQLS